MKFELKSKVVEKKNLSAHYSYHVGEVIAITPDNCYMVELYGCFHKYKEIELLSEDEAEVEQLRLEEVQSQLDADFDAVRDQLKDKLSQAAALVKEAAAIAESTKKDFSSLRNECRPLFRALIDAGWRASSMAC